MKKSILFCMAAAVMCVACNEKEAPVEPKGVLQFTVVQDIDGLDTRASETTVVDHEADVNNMAVYIFNGDGDFETSAEISSFTSGETYSVECKAGTGKTVYVVANVPSSVNLASCTTLAAFEAKNLDLYQCNDYNGFVMGGSKTNVSITKDNTTPVSITISRYVSRVTLKSVKNSLPASLGSITVNSVMLTNVVGSQNLTGGDSFNFWYNPMGRKNKTSSSSDPASSTHIIDGSSYVSDAGDLVFTTASATITNGSTNTTKYRLYCYPNPTTTDRHGWAATMTARYTRLVITATIAGTKYYYPVNIPTPERNTCYDVSVNIHNLGSDDPDVPVELGTLDITITVSGWESGTAISENL